MLKGKDISLRPLQPEDAAQTLLLRQDTESNKAMMGYPFPVNLESERTWIGNLYPQGERKSIFLAVEENQSGHFIGYLSARSINYINSTAEFGIILRGNSRGKGYCKQAMSLFFDFLFQDINLRKINLYVLEDNTPAIAAYRGLGFLEEGLLKKQVWQDGKYKNLLIMSLFLPDFKR